jgi:spore germination protein GerM
MKRQTSASQVEPFKEKRTMATESQEQVEQPNITDALLEGDEHATEVDVQSANEGKVRDDGGASDKDAKGDKKPEASTEDGAQPSKGMNKALQRMQQRQTAIESTVHEIRELLRQQAKRAEPTEEDEIAAAVEELGLNDPDAVVDVKTAVKLVEKLGDAKTRRAVKKLREELAGKLEQTQVDPNVALEQYVTTNYDGDTQAIIEEARDLVRARVQEAGGLNAFGRAGMEMLAQQCLDQAAKNLGATRKSQTPEKTGQKPKQAAKSKEGASHVKGGWSSDTGAVIRKQYKSAQAVLDDMLENGVNIPLPT